MAIRSTVPGACERSSWNSAECSESTGITRAPVASASCITRSPPTTRLSLLASPTSIPSPSAATVGASPAEPTRPFRTRSASDSVIRRTRPSAPPSTSPLQVPRAWAALRSSWRLTRFTSNSDACASSRSQLDRRQADDLDVVAARDDVQRLHADRAGGAKDHELPHEEEV